ncbi:unnamed protein product [Brachionus calyciflorus]|uniref:Uncharacterized protein n=1 Tax=Brachionus calyciflorus TaxID=104777 RepID=A0A813UZ27_9BILA|nr:unnamed protein product [Brachionus calyciflorus]
MIEYLDSNFRIYKELAFKSNFSMLLKIQWIKLLDEIESNLTKDNTRSLVFFSKMHECLDIITDFFTYDNQGVQLDFLCSIEKFKQLKRYLNYSRMDTQNLIQLYYQEMIEIQNSLRFGDYGKLICRACYHCKEQILAVEILKCKNILPMDQNGLSDPYVEIDLKPKFVFLSCDKQTTSVVKKTLNPVYNETFDFKINEKCLNQTGNVIHFTVMDHDLMWTNDFEGEAFLDLSSVPKLKGDSSDINYKDLKYSELLLIRPKDFPSKIIDVLEYRKDQDKLALEFLKERKDKLYI